MAASLACPLVHGTKGTQAQGKVTVAGDCEFDVLTANGCGKAPHPVEGNLGIRAGYRRRCSLTHRPVTHGGAFMANGKAGTSSRETEVSGIPADGYRIRRIARQRCLLGKQRGGGKLLGGQQGGEGGGSGEQPDTECRKHANQDNDHDQLHQREATLRTISVVSHASPSQTRRPLNLTSPPALTSNWQSIWPYFMNRSPR